MTDTLHTPGPWKALPNSGYVYGLIGAKIDVVVARCGNFSDKELAVFNADRWTADTHMCAAAPDMFEALKAVTKEFVAFMERSGFSNETANAVAPVINARAALSKARGETQKTQS